MNRTLLLATGNKNKLIEVRRMLQPLGIRVELPDSALLAGIVEDGETFAENALIKARSIFAATGLATIADDSGLCVDALDGRPGVYSARYLGEHTSYQEKINGLLAELADIPKERRTARFVCAIAVVTPKEERVFEDECVGFIGYEARGHNGFGYDPVFMVGAHSYSELTDEQKDAISHRGAALRKLAQEIEGIQF